MDRLTLHEVVGHVEESADVGLVLFAHLVGHQHRVGRWPAQDEATFRPGGDDHRVLGDLGLHESENLGAIVLASIRPADAAAGHRAASQVDSFDLQSVHEDLGERDRLGHVGHVPASGA